jgi:hypothetical protein
VKKVFQVSEVNLAFQDRPALMVFQDQKVKQDYVETKVI